MANLDRWCQRCTGAGSPYQGEGRECPPVPINHSPSAVYVHIPFCVRKCLYCDFASYPGKEHLFAPYVEALRTEIRREAERFPDARISTIFFGGGTPNVLSPERLASILDDVKRSFHVDAEAEISIEANPAVSIEDRESSIQQPVSAAFNRLSLAVQSLHDNELQRLGRIHTTRQAAEAFHEAREVGFGNISVDLMYGIPEQTLTSWRETLRGVLELGPEHVSLYSLSVEEGTPFWDMCQAGGLQLPGSDAEADMYEMAIRTLKGEGFVHYEISNFARPGFECRHNMTYWRNEPYFGFGAGATAYTKRSAVSGQRSASNRTENQRTRRTNVREVEEYIRRIEAGESAVEFEECPDARMSMGETMFLGLRMLSGVSLDGFRQRYGVSLDETFGPEIAGLTIRGLLEEKDGQVRLTRTGLLLANEVFAEFVGQT